MSSGLKGTFWDKTQVNGKHLSFAAPQLPVHAQEGMMRSRRTSSLVAMQLKVLLS